MYILLLHLYFLFYLHIDMVFIVFCQFVSIELVWILDFKKHYYYSLILIDILLINSSIYTKYILKVLNDRVMV